MRALGGARFDGARSAVAPEWSAFGSYCFLLPRLELLEAAGCCLLSCTLAWRPQLSPAERWACSYVALHEMPHFVRLCLLYTQFIPYHTLSYHTHHTLLIPSAGLISWM